MVDAADGSAIPCSVSWAISKFVSEKKFCHRAPLKKETLRLYGFRINSSPRTNLFVATYSIADVAISLGCHLYPRPDLTTIPTSYAEQVQARPAVWNEECKVP